VRPEAAVPPAATAATSAAQAPAAAAALELGGADFDLAAELSGAFGDRGGAGASSASVESDGFAEVFAAFKAGVRREVGEGDTEAHFDLGIAYKEMGLLDDAIGEFRFAMADAARRLACLHMMGVCALDLGRGADAVSHLSEALAGGALPREQEAALRLDLGRAHQATGDRARARAAYQAVRALSPDFGDVERLLAELDAAPAEPPAQGESEAFESFDDLIADDPHGALSSPPPKYESFDELISDESDLESAAPSGGAANPPEPEGAEAEAEITLTEVALDPPPERAPSPPEPPAATPRSSAPEPPAPAKGAPAQPARRKKKISFV
jgi:tetratricopeptide (TPR) repeat protein